MRSTDPYEIEVLRNALRSCLRADLPSRGSSLADMATRQAKGAQKLASPAARYTLTTKDGEVHKRKPAHGQWTTVVHATQTSPPGYSRETITQWDYMDSRYVKAIWSLKSTHIQSILAHYSPSKEQRRISARHLAAKAVAQYPTQKVRQRARMLALTLLLNPWAASRLHDVFDMTPAEWRASEHRKTLYKLKAWLARVDVDALLAWQDACDVYHFDCMQNPPCGGL